MTMFEFRRWRKKMGLSIAEAKEALGVGSVNTIKKYETEGAPLYIGLACAALANGLASFSDNEKKSN